MIQEIDSTPASGSLQVRESPMDTTFNINIDMAMGLCAPAFRSLSRQIRRTFTASKAHEDDPFMFAGQAAFAFILQQ